MAKDINNIMRKIRDNDQSEKNKSWKKQVKGMNQSMNGMKGAFNDDGGMVSKGQKAKDRREAYMVEEEYKEGDKKKKPRMKGSLVKGVSSKEVGKEKLSSSEDEVDGKKVKRIEQAHELS
jgi:hypothetical protein